MGRGAGCLAALLLCCPAVLPLGSLRWCAVSDAELAKCSEMGKAFAAAGLLPELACVRGDSAVGCLAMINGSLADAATVDGGLVYRAGREFGLQPVAGESYGQELGASYYAVAVVRSASNLTLDGLRGARSCHTAVNRTAGWNVPLGLLLDSGRMSALGCDLAGAAAGFFSASCAPGATGPGYPESLCRLCKGDAAGEGRCEPSPREEYYGYEGAFRCLAEGAGEVAFVKHSTVPETLQGTTPPPAWAGGLRATDFRLLCRDGSRAAVGAWRGCHLARVPAHAVVTRAGADGGLVFRLLDRGQQRFGGGGGGGGGALAFRMFGSAAYGGKDLLFKDSTVELVPVPGQNYQAWLAGEYLQVLRGLDCDPTRLPEFLRWCVLSAAEIQKCSQMAVAFKGKGLRPSIQCVSAESHSHCMDQIQKRAVDAVTLAGEDIYTAGRAYGLVPAAGERYAEGDTTNTYYAVAVVRRASNNGDAFTVHELRGRRSCHTGYGRRAGWTLPVGLLLSKGLIQPQGCSVLEAVSTFFSASCVPTAERKGFPPNLCELCVGDDNRNHKCENSTQERYYGYAGAFRCLAERRGEVAFVKHTTVFENTEGHSAAPWASQLRLADFQLLCPNGARAEVGQFAECHWGHVPPRAIVVHPQTNALAVYGLLDKAQDFFGDDDNNNGFKMFNSSEFQGQDLIFRDATTAIVPAGERTTSAAWLGQPFLEALEGWWSFSSSPQCSGAAARPVDLSLLLLMPSLAFAQYFSA